MSFKFNSVRRKSSKKLSTYLRTHQQVTTLIQYIMLHNLNINTIFNLLCIFSIIFCYFIINR